MRHPHKANILEPADNFLFMNIEPNDLKNGLKSQAYNLLVNSGPTVYTEVIEALRGFFLGIQKTKVVWGKSLP